MVTYNDECINATEYCCWITNLPSAHLLQIEDCESGTPDDWRRDQFNELLLGTRSGLARQTLVIYEDGIKEIFKYAVKHNEEPN